MAEQGVDQGLAQEIRTILIESPKTIRHFSGDGEPARAQEFAEQVRRAWASLPVNTTAAKKLDIIFENVGSNIKAELRCAEPDVRADPEKLLNLILAVFGERRTPMQLRQLMEQQRQLVGESVRDFSNRMMGHFVSLQNRQKALDLPKAPESDLTEHLVTALSDITLTRTLREKRKLAPGLTFREIRQIAIDWFDDGLSQESNIVAAVAATKSETQELRELVTKQTEVLTSLLEKFSNLAAQQPREILCWNCNKAGHLQRRCPESTSSGNAPPRR